MLKRHVTLINLAEGVQALRANHSPALASRETFRTIRNSWHADEAVADAGRAEGLKSE